MSKPAILKVVYRDDHTELIQGDFDFVIGLNKYSLKTFIEGTSKSKGRGKPKLIELQNQVKDKILRLTRNGNIIKNHSKLASLGIEYNALDAYNSDISKEVYCDMVSASEHSLLHDDSLPFLMNYRNTPDAEVAGYLCRISRIGHSYDDAKDTIESFMKGVRCKSNKSLMKIAKLCLKQLENKRHHEYPNEIYLLRKEGLPEEVVFELESMFEDESGIFKQWQKFIRKYSKIADAL